MTILQYLSAATLQHLSAATGTLGAVLWWRSAQVRLRFVRGGKWRFDTVEDALRSQGRISSAAAAFTGLSVLFLAIDQFCR